MGLLKHLKNMLNSGESTDFSVIFLDGNGTKVEKKVHKLLLRQSPYFAAMLDLQGTEARRGSVTIDIITKETFDVVVHYLYTDELPENITMEQAIDIASAGDYLQLTEMKSLAIEQWKALYTLFTDGDAVISALRSFAAVSLNIDPTSPDWRSVAEVFIIAACDPEIEFSIEEESTSFVEFLVCLCGQSFPHFTVEFLCNWVMAEKINLTDEEREEGLAVAAELVEYINFDGIGLRALTLISKKNILPLDYLLQEMQRLAEKGDKPVSDKVVYKLELRNSHVVELVYDLNYLLLKFQVNSNGKVDWSFLRGPQQTCRTAVKISTWRSSKEWPGNTQSGTETFGRMSPISLSVEVALQPHGYTGSIQHTYRVKPDDVVHETTKAVEDQYSSESSDSSSDD